MPLLRWSNPGHDTRRASSLVRGAECREINLRIRRREKNVLDIPFYRPGHITSVRFSFAFFGVNERYGDFSPFITTKPASSPCWFSIEGSGRELATVNRQQF